MIFNGNRMKTRVIFYALAVVAAAVATSCVKEEIDPQEKPDVVITGQVFEANHEVLTKSTLIDLTPTWVDGDKIYVSGANGGAECTFAGENKFQTEKDVTVASPFYAIYPAAEGNSIDRETGVRMSLLEHSLLLLQARLMSFSSRMS